MWLSQQSLQRCVSSRYTHSHTHSLIHTHTNTKARGIKERERELEIAGAAVTVLNKARNSWKLSGAIFFFFFFIFIFFFSCLTPPTMAIDSSRTAEKVCVSVRERGNLFFFVFFFFSVSSRMEKPQNAIELLCSVSSHPKDRRLIWMFETETETETSKRENGTLLEVSRLLISNDW